MKASKLDTYSTMAFSLFYGQLKYIHKIKILINTQWKFQSFMIIIIIIIIFPILRGRWNNRHGSSTRGNKPNLAKALTRKQQIFRSMFCFGDLNMATSDNLFLKIW